MLDAKSPRFAPRSQNIALLLLSLFFLPVDSFVLAVSYVVHYILRMEAQARRQQKLFSKNFEQRTILVTGVGMTKGLYLARLFYEAGHNVIGADFEPNGTLVCGRVSKSLIRFYRLVQPSKRKGPAEYIQGLLDIVRKENVELWVSCSGVASAVEDGMAMEIIEARSGCRAVQFNVKTTQLLHEKHSFIEYTKSLGLTVPETHTVTSRAAVARILAQAPTGRRYILKSVGMDDSSRADMTLLPRPTTEETSQHIARFNASEQSPWIVQQYIRGNEYCTHSLVINGYVKAFVACPSSELLMHYEALSSSCALSKAMLEFTEIFASHSGDSFTGHLSFDFMVEDAGNPAKMVLYPIECNPRAHTAVALFDGTSRMATTYLSLLSRKSVDKRRTEVVVPLHRNKYYWIGHDFVELLIFPVLSLLSFQGSIVEVKNCGQEFMSHLLFWRDGTYELWDPLPWWWLYHVYWPMQFLYSLRSGTKWSRINVSTTKMFHC